MEQALVFLLLVSSILVDNAILASESAEPLCTSKFDFEEKLLHKVMRMELSMEVFQKEVTEKLAEFERLKGAESCQCPDMWIPFKGSCYLFSQEDKTALNAQYYCHQHQSHLVKVDNNDENNFLKLQSTYLKDANHWIDLSDESTEGVWVRSDGSSGYTNWHPTEPQGHRTENCAALFHPYQYQWVDITCTALLKPICEREQPAYVFVGP